MTIDREEITGLILAGGRGSRMGGVDKGLVPYQGRPLVMHVLERFAPQVGRVLISANRNRDAYAALGAHVLVDADDLEPYAGPLAGVRAALARCTTPWLAVVPCDVPRLPRDLVQRLAAGVSNARAAVAAVEGKVQPLCCLLDVALTPALESALASGERKAARWLDRVCAGAVVFADAEAFLNINAESQLACAQRPDEN